MCVNVCVWCTCVCMCVCMCMYVCVCVCACFKVSSHIPCPHHPDSTQHTYTPERMHACLMTECVSFLRYCKKEGVQTKLTNLATAAIVRIFMISYYGLAFTAFFQIQLNDLWTLQFVAYFTLVCVCVCVSLIFIVCVCLYCFVTVLEILFETMCINVCINEALY